MTVVAFIKKHISRAMAFCAALARKAFARPSNISFLTSQTDGKKWADDSELEKKFNVPVKADPSVRKDTPKEEREKPRTTLFGDYPPSPF